MLLFCYYELIVTLDFSDFFIAGLSLLCLAVMLISLSRFDILEFDSICYLLLANIRLQRSSQQSVLAIGFFPRQIQFGATEVPITSQFGVNGTLQL